MATGEQGGGGRKKIYVPIWGGVGYSVVKGRGRGELQKERSEVERAPVNGKQP